MILISIGGNLSRSSETSPLQTCRQAAEGLAALPGVRAAGISRWYSTDPVPPSDQPKYVNGVCRLEVRDGAVEPDPAELLLELQTMEALAGRVRGEPNAARTLDLDIIAMGVAGQSVRAAPDPVLPHPRAHLRGFVLIPLLDVAPEWRHPVLGKTARELLAALPDQGVRLL